MLMEKIEKEKEAIRAYQAKRMEDAKTNPDILLSPRSMSLKVKAKVENMYRIYLEGVVTDIPSKDEEDIYNAMHRTQALNIPAYQENFAARLIKLNQIDYNTWRTGDVQKIYE